MTLLPKPRREIDDARLDFVRPQPCLISEFGTNAAAEEHRKVCDWLRMPVEERCSDPHHIRKGAQSGMGTKPSDFRTVPLCRTGHDEHDNLGHDRFCAKYDIDLIAHANRINIAFVRVWKPKVQLERRRVTPGLKSITVNCPCSDEHDVPGSKVSRSDIGLQYRCIRTNEVFRVAVSG